MQTKHTCFRITKTVLYHTENSVIRIICALSCFIQRVYQNNEDGLWKRNS